MKILWVSSFFPYPPDNGAKIREYFLIRELAEKHDISVFSLVQSADELDGSEPLQKICQNVTGVLPENKLPNLLDGRRQWYDVPMGILSPHPKFMYGRPSMNVVRQLHAELSSGKYDVVIVESLVTVNYLWDFLHLPNKPIMILSELNIESLIQEQTLRHARGVIQKLRKWIYYHSFVRFEKQTCQLFDKIIVVSEKDYLDIQTLFPSLKAEHLILAPNGVDIQWNDIGNIPKEENTLIYNGALTYSANYDAIYYFLNKIFPLIIKQIPDVKLKITGKTDGVDISSLPHHQNVLFTGYVPDIRPVVKSSMVCVVPIQVGGGTRLKILEAMALGTPVVSTSKGAEGLHLEHGKDLLIADSPEDFANAVILVMRDRKLQNQLMENALQTVSSLYSWNGIAKQLELAITSLYQSN